jgi:hypothetical protein
MWVRFGEGKNGLLLLFTREPADLSDLDGNQFHQFRVDAAEDSSCFLLWQTHEHDGSPAEHRHRTPRVA